ncbi:MAG TPA: sporulation integral membrane protein YtvI [Clostridiaceae bacterium]|nr:sporulation integral membrane protein YtvI [Clostridiaceae bacterium]
MENSNSYVKKYDKILIYVTIYTLTFFLFVKTLPYTIPFVLAFAIAAMVTPFVKKLLLWTKQKIHENLIILISLLTFYGILGTFVSVIIIRLINQAVLLVSNSILYLNEHYDGIVSWVEGQYAWIASNIQSLDPSIIEAGSDMLGSFLASLQDVLVAVGKAIGGFTLDILASLPNLLLILIFTVVCSFFFTKKMISNPEFIYAYLPTSNQQEHKVKDIITQGKNMILRYSGSYLLIIMITGVISIIGYIILGIPYALILGLITAFLDLLPVLGVSVAYLPLALYYFAQGNYTIPLGLGILWVVVAVGRNIWEPKILSTSLNINPVITIMAIFIGLKMAGILGMFFLIFMAVGFKVLQTVGVLDTFQEEQKSKKSS